MKLMMRGASLFFFSIVCSIVLLLGQSTIVAHAASTTGMVRFVHAAVGIGPINPAQPVQPAQPAQPTQPAQGTTTPAMPMTVAGAPGAVDIFVDGQSVATQIAYGAASNYLPIAAGAHQVSVAPTGKGVAAAVITQSIAVTAGTSETVAIIGGAANAPFELKAFADTNTTIMTANTVMGNGLTTNTTATSATGMAQARVYQLTSALGTINVQINNKDIVIALQPQMASKYHIVQPGAATFQVTTQNGQKMPITAMTQTGQITPLTMALQPNAVQSIFVVDTPAQMMTTNGSGATQADPSGKLPATVTATANGNTMMQIMAGTSTTPAIPGMPQTGSDPKGSNGAGALPLIAGLLFLCCVGERSRRLLHIGLGRQK